MKKLKRFRIPAAFALFLCLFSGVWAQQDAAVIQSSGSGSEARPSATSELEAKKALYKELGVTWTYDEGSSLDVAKEVLLGNQVQSASEASPEAKQRMLAREFRDNKENLYKNDPEKFHSMVKELGYTGYSRTVISAEDWKNMDAEKRAYVNAHPAEFEIQSQPSTK